MACAGRLSEPPGVASLARGVHSATAVRAACPLRVALAPQAKAAKASDHGDPPFWPGCACVACGARLTQSRISASAYGNLRDMPILRIVQAGQRELERAAEALATRIPEPLG